MEKLAQAKRALQTLSDILEEPFSTITRDAAIQRFEYSCEAVWKAVREWLYENESIEENHPRGCYRKLYQIGRIDETLSLSFWNRSMIATVRHTPTSKPWQKEFMPTFQSIWNLSSKCSTRFTTEFP